MQIRDRFTIPEIKKYKSGKLWKSFMDYFFYIFLQQYLWMVSASDIYFHGFELELVKHARGEMF